MTSSMSPQQMRHASAYDDVPDTPDADDAHQPGGIEQRDHTRKVSATTHEPVPWDGKVPGAQSPRIEGLHASGTGFTEREEVLRSVEVSESKLAEIEQLGSCGVPCRFRSNEYLTRSRRRHDARRSMDRRPRVRRTPPHDRPGCHADAHREVNRFGPWFGLDRVL